MSESYWKNVVEAALLAAGKPLQIADLGQLFAPEERPTDAQLHASLDALAADYAERALELKLTASGWRVQVRGAFAAEISRLWPERPARYSRALLETLALIAYRQPVTRGEIETVRGVAVNPNIIKTLLERNWVRVVGTRDVPGRPELLGTTHEFLDYFGLQSVDELPPLAELKAMTEINMQLDLAEGAAGAAEGEAAAADEAAATLNEARAPAAADEAPAAAASNEAPASSNEAPAATDEVSVASHEARATSKEVPAASNEAPPASNEVSAASNEARAANETRAAAKVPAILKAAAAIEAVMGQDATDDLLEAADADEPGFIQAESFIDDEEGFAEEDRFAEEDGLAEEDDGSDQDEDSSGRRDAADLVAAARSGD